MSIDYMLLISIALIPITIWEIKRKPKWIKEAEEEMERASHVWELLKQILEAED